MRTGKRRSRLGSTVLEFTLVGIPMIFICISVVEVARGMWTYHTLAYAVREGVRYASMHGKGCASPNTCSVTVGNITGVIQAAGVGLDSSAVKLTFSPTGGVATDTMTNLASNTTTWPPAGSNATGQTVQISAMYPFRTFLAVFWAGAGQGIRDSGTFYLPASSSEPIQF